MSDGLMSGPLEGQRVLITGASVGIGAAIARDLSAAGCVVGLCARRADLLQTVADSCGPHARHWAVDLSNLDAIEAFVAQVEGELGGIDVLINNAGMPKRRHITALTVAEVDEVMALNYLSPVRLI